ncbi:MULTISPECIES: tryptophan 2,3-dioxygenase family protein [unclassified Streptomyces]|uniref:tryptophan 2,3-dioxygenase family protein n=1 Tax=unclassified Streptomyces TaxID=2593676 RepID=UPI0022B63B11|nr:MULTISPECIES: tryptophan 2,3-dioxygenase family protein [unclassified Streptomyces]MCZ7415704.1 tryptophan 2,3-dioxygenase family protein [Streptomyces sp. WMMC897]MCZ7434485.1 tryptophan 2,3-dioxygenase family protein [Streptomyces sp. WMMC1477]
MVTAMEQRREAAADRTLTYDDYLELTTLLGLQRPLSAHPDELHFIVVHQSMELWFKLLAHDLRRVVAFLDADRLPECCTVMRRVNDVMTALLAQMRSLRDLPPHSFHAFRGVLGRASGFQSAQFREVEVCSGLRDEGYLRDLRGVCGGVLPEAVVRNLGRRSVAEAHREAAHRAGLCDWAALYTDEGAASPLYVLSEQLMDYDELWLRWRTEHVALVLRMNGGSARGTAGTEIGYLQRTLRHRFFPYLWESRDTLAADPAGGDNERGARAG